MTTCVNDAAPPVFLHIGAMKTGTTFLQSVLTEHRDQLAAQGYLFPGQTWKDQIRAAQEVARSVPDDPAIRHETQGSWQSLVREMLAHDGAASVVSMEFLSHASRKDAGTAVSSLAPAQVHVVLTVRDTAGIIPARWQTAVRSGRTTDWPAYRVAVRKAVGLRGRLGKFSDPTAAAFRRTQDVAAMIDAWGRWVPPQHLHVVTAPASGGDPSVLWRRFAGVVGLDAQWAEDTSRANESLGFASTELLRRVNAALGTVLPSDYNATVREQLAGRILSARSGEETRPRLDRPTYDFALTWNRRARAAIARSGAVLVGDADDLPTHPIARHDRAVADAQGPPGEEELMRAATHAREGMRDLVARRARRAAERGLEVDDLHPAAARGTAHSPPSAGDPVAAAVGEIAELCHAAIELRRRQRQ